MSERSENAQPQEDNDGPIPEEVLEHFPEGLALFHRLRMIAAGKLPPESVLGRRLSQKTEKGQSSR
jgi:hypothetical protein